jgi:siroheme synthase
MGLARLEAIGESLTSNGCDPGTPAAIVSRATWPDEQVRIGTLGNIHTEATGLSSPAILVLGNVIAFGRESHST